MIVELGAEVSHPARERKGRQALVVAQAALDDVVGQVGQELEVGRPRATRDDPVADLGQAARADPAGDRLAARLVGAEPGQEPGEVDDAGPVVGRRSRPEPTWAPAARSGSKSYGVSSASGRQDPARRTADEDRLEGMAVDRASAEGDDVPQWRRRAAPRRCRRRRGAADLDEDRAGAVRARRSPGTRSAPLARIHGTVARVWTFWTTVGMPNRPRSVGYGGRCSGWPRLPSSALSRTVSSPSMYAPWTGRTRRPSDRGPAEHVGADEARLLGRGDGGLERADDRRSPPTRTAMNASLAPIAKAAMAAPSITAYGSRSSSVRSVNDGRIGAVAVGDDEPARRRRGAARAPATSRRSGSRPRRGRGGRHRRSGRWCAAGPSSVVARRRRVEGAGRHGRVEVGRVRRLGMGEEDRAASGARRGCEDVRHRAQFRRAGRRPAVAPAEGCRRGRPGRSLSDGMSAPPAAVAPSAVAAVIAGCLEAEVAVVGGGAVDHRVPRAGGLADPLERGDRQVAVVGLGRLEDRRASAPGRGRTRRGSRRPRPGRSGGEVARRPRRGRAGRTGGAPIPRAARRTSRARPSGRG